MFIMDYWLNLSYESNKKQDIVYIKVHDSTISLEKEDKSQWMTVYLLKTSKLIICDFRHIFFFKYDMLKICNLSFNSKYRIPMQISHSHKGISFMRVHRVN